MRLRFSKQKIGIGIVVFLELALVFIFIYFLCFQAQTIHIHGIYINKPQHVINIDLIDHKGRPFRTSTIQGHWVLLFFGFTQCKMVCPTTMQILNQTYTILETTLAKRDLPQVVFISVDPARDSISNLNHFINQFNEHFIGVKGSQENILHLQKILHVTRSSNPLNHSMDILLLNPHSQVQAYFKFPIQANRLATDYVAILSSKA